MFRSFGFRGVRSVCLAASASLAAALVCLAPQAGAAPSPVGPPEAAGSSLPPELVALEQKMQALHVNSVRFSALYELSLGSLPGTKGFSLTLPIEGTGEASVSPEEGFAKVGLFGQDTEVRIVGHTTYTRKPNASEADKGRPWVRETHSNAVAGIDPLGLGSGVAGAGTNGEAQGASSAGSFDGLAGVLNESTTVTEVGPEIVNGRQATEFAATLSPTKLLAGVSTELLAHMKRLGSLSAQLYVFFAPNGLPVRASWTVGAGRARITASVDILATEVPVTVKAPPADKTISAARYKKLEAAKKRREKAQQRRLRRCIKRLRRHRHNSVKQVRKCFRGSGSVEVQQRHPRQRGHRRGSRKSKQ